MRNDQKYSLEVLCSAYKNATKQDNVVMLLMPPDTCDIEIESIGVDLDSTVQEILMK